MWTSWCIAYILRYCQNIGQYQRVTRNAAYNNELFCIITELQNLSQWLMFYWRVCTVEIRFLYDSDITYKKWQDYNSSRVKRLILLPKTKTSVFGNHFLQKCSRGVWGVEGLLVCVRKVKLSARAGGELRLVNVSGSAG